MTIPHKQFIEVWETSKSLSDIANKLGISELMCRSKAAYYRKKGINLKHLKKGLDVEALELFRQGLAKEKMAVA